MVKQKGIQEKRIGARLRISLRIGQTIPKVTPTISSSPFLLVREWTSHDLLDESFIVDHAFTIFNSIHDLGDLVSVEALTKGKEDVPKLSAKDLSSLVLIEDTESFHEVVEGADLLLLLELLVHWEPLLEAQPLVTLGVLSAGGLVDHGVGGLETAGTGDIPDLAGVNLSITFLVVEVEHLLRLVFSNAGHDGVGRG